MCFPLGSIDPLEVPWIGSNDLDPLGIPWIQSNDSRKISIHSESRGSDRTILERSRSSVSPSGSRGCLWKMAGEFSPEANGLWHANCGAAPKERQNGAAHSAGSVKSEFTSERESPRSARSIYLPDILFSANEAAHAWRREFHLALSSLGIRF